jgi:hypothetical protein
VLIKSISLNHLYLVNSAPKLDKRTDSASRDTSRVVDFTVETVDTASSRWRRGINVNGIASNASASSAAVCCRPLCNVYRHGFFKYASLLDTELESTDWPLNHCSILAVSRQWRSRNVIHSSSRPNRASSAVASWDFVWEDPAAFIMSIAVQWGARCKSFTPDSDEAVHLIQATCLVLLFSALQVRCMCPANWQ